MATTSFEDFYQVPNLTFDIAKLRAGLEEILKLKKLKDEGVINQDEFEMAKKKLLR